MSSPNFSDSISQHFAQVADGIEAKVYRYVTENRVGPAVGWQCTCMLCTSSGMLVIFLSAAIFPINHVLVGESHVLPWIFVDVVSVGEKL
jgi:hypothetical protein